MAKEKCTLEELKVQSIVTALDDEQMNQVKGGAAPMRGRFYTYRTRWTAVDVRSEFQDVQTLRGPQAK
ncbi:MAG: pinensin family lanthipeptide [Saprospiraceae bacterium]|nr:pinensin family lanthipeptide [Saprospiraceae bacterium]